ncbi:unnamed protein product [Camellia sinensis]
MLDFGMDRSWMQLHNRRLHQYIDGVKEFIMFARDHMKSRTSKIWCPCNRCNNRIQKTIDEVEIHLFAYGVVTTYTRWVYHGEDFELNDSDPSENENDEYFNDVTEKSNSPNTAVREIVHDIHSGPSTFAYTREASSSRNPDLSGAHGSEGNTFARLMRDAEQELYPNCQRYSKLSFINCIGQRGYVPNKLAAMSFASTSTQSIPSFTSKFVPPTTSASTSAAASASTSMHEVISQASYLDTSSTDCCIASRYNRAQGKRLD